MKYNVYQVSAGGRVYANPDGNVIRVLIANDKQDYVTIQMYLEQAQELQLKLNKAIKELAHEVATSTA